MIYATVELTITAPDSFAAYGAKAGPALSKYGGQPIAMSGEAIRIEGDAPVPSRAVILSFPDKEAALGWINDPEFAEIHALRRGSGQSQILLLA